MASHTIVLQLPRAVRRRLQRLSLKTRHKVVFRRCQMVLQLATGAHPAAIAVGLGCAVDRLPRATSVSARGRNESEAQKESGATAARDQATRARVGSGADA